jgi:hypothetical protein
MITVVITRKDGSILKGFFEDRKLAEEWVSKHKLKGKEEQEITTPTRIKGSKLLEEVEGPMGITLYRQLLEADFKVEYLEDDLETREYKLNQLRKERNKILRNTDWLFISDVNIDTKHRKYYKEYRQYLRNITKTLGNSDKFNFEKFDHWLRRNYPEEFMDGGKSENIIKVFNAYLEG